MVTGIRISRISLMLGKWIRKRYHLKASGTGGKILNRVDIVENVIAMVYVEMQK